MLISRKMNAARLGCIVVSALALASGCGARSSLHDAASTSATTSGSGGGGYTTSSSGPGGGGGGGDAPSLCTWSERFGDAYGQHVLSMAVDPSNAIYVAGLFKGTLDLGDQTLDSQDPSSPLLGPAFLTKLDPSGAPLWSKVLGAPMDARGVSVAVDPAGNVIIGVISSAPIDFGNGPVQPNGTYAALVAKLDPDGNALWSRNLVAPPNPDGFFHELHLGVDSAGNIVASGATDGVPPYAIVLAKVDPAGSDVWTHAFAPKDVGLPYLNNTRPVFDAQGNVTIAPNAYGTHVSIDFGGGPVTADGTGSIMVAKFDAAGNHVYSRLLDLMGGVGSAPENVYHVWPSPIVGASGGEIFISTAFWGTVDLGLGPLSATPDGSLLVAKLDAAGNTVWSKSYGDYAAPDGLALAPGGGVLLSGYLGGSVDFGGGLLENTSSGVDLFVAALDGASGDHRKSRRYEGSLESSSDGDPLFLVATDAAGAPIISGDLYGDLTFCGNTLTSAGNADIFIAKLAP